MSWMLVVAVLVAGTLATFTDWLFMGVLFHDRYERYPEVWWPQFREQGDRRAIVISCVLAFVTSAAIIGLCNWAGVHTIGGGLAVALLAWIAGPFIVTVTNGFWVKIDPLITLAHCAGYLARFLIAGIAAGLVLA
jgi:hypothetical protein